METTKEFYDQFPDEDDWMTLNLKLADAKIVQNELIQQLLGYYSGYLAMVDLGISSNRARKMNRLNNRLLFDLAQGYYMIQKYTENYEPKVCF